MTRGRHVHPRGGAAAGGLLLLGAVAGTATYLAARDDPTPPPTTTTTAATRAATTAEIADAVVESLRSDLDVPLTEGEASCIAGALLEVAGEGGAADWTATPPPTLTAAQRDGLLRAVVSCLPEPKARALLGEPTPSTTRPAELPDE